MIEPVVDPTIIEGYLTDASNVRGHAEALLRPRTTQEVAEVVAHCQKNGIPLTITAARTSTTAAPVPFGGWVMSTELLNQIEHIGHDTATAQAGVNLGTFQDEIEQTGRFFPPDPTSRHDCTLGAAIATNASGARSFRYGPTRPWIEALEVVLPTGEIVSIMRGDPIPANWPVPKWQPPTAKSAAGYEPPESLLDLFIGQEGTLGVVTRATVRLTELPPDVFGIFAFFPDRVRAVGFMELARKASREARGGALAPRCIEYFDHNCLDIARSRVPGVPDEAYAALFCEQEVWDPDDLDDHLSAWLNALEISGAFADDTIVADDPPSRDLLLHVRHAIPAGINEMVVRNGMPKVGTDLSVPDAGLGRMMEAYEKAPLPSFLFGHLADNHLHLNLLPTTPAELATARAYYDELATMAVNLGGSVSAEHGIGKVKTKHLALMCRPEVIEGFRRLKRHLDPNWILGQGTLFDEHAN